MSAREFTDDMREISGMGGGYEAACRAMVLAGLAWLDAHPEAKPTFSSFRVVYGVVKEDNADAEQLSAAMLAAAESGGGATGAMHQATVAHVLRINLVGWDAYAAEMRDARKKELEA